MILPSMNLLIAKSESSNTASNVSLSVVTTQTWDHHDFLLQLLLLEECAKFQHLLFETQKYPVWIHGNPNHL